MEKRFYLGAVLLVVMLVLGLLAAGVMRSLHLPAQQALEQAATLALDGDMAQAAVIAEQACDRWEIGRKMTASLADHGPMDQVEELIAELRVYAAAEEVPHFAACCSRLSTLIRAMYDAHSLSWWNFL